MLVFFDENWRLFQIKKTHIICLFHVEISMATKLYLDVEAKFG